MSPIQPPEAAVGGVLVRHRHARPRRLQPRALRRARVARRSASRSRCSATLIGLAIGLVTGFIRWLDAIVMRVMDGLMSIPPVLLAIALMALTKASIDNVIVAITLAEVPRVVRLVRSLVLTLARAAVRRGGDRRGHDACRASCCATSCRTPWRRCWCRRPTSAPRR